MTKQFHVVRRELHPGIFEYGIASFYKEAWAGEPKMVIPFHNFGDDNPVGRLRQIIADLHYALLHPVVDFKDL